MAITSHTYTANDVDNSPRGAHYVFTATKHDTNYLEDPLISGRKIVSKGISINRVDEAVKVEFADKGPAQSVGRQHTFEAGALAAGVCHPMNVVKVFSTGTGANVIVKIWV